MITFFRKLSITVKLLLVGLLPIALLIYFAFIIYHEKGQKLKLLGDYRNQIELSESVQSLTSSLAKERQYSYPAVFINETSQTVKERRAITDSLIEELNMRSDISFANFTTFTFLDNLSNIRLLSDTDSSVNTDQITDFYSRAIFRLNSINLFAPPGIKSLTLINKDLVSTRILAEMLSFLEIIRTNVYNLLLGSQNFDERFKETYSLFKTYHSIESEFNLKTTEETQAVFVTLKNSGEFSPMLNYLNTMFKSPTLDSTYNSQEWWDISTKGLSALEKQRKTLWRSLYTRVNDLYFDEKRIEKRTIIILALAILFVLGFIIYAIDHITRILKELEKAAGKISKGATGIVLKAMPRGIIGRLSKSILEIDKNNLVLAKAANEIGKGNFSVVVNARSDDDVLGVSIKKMKRSLREFNSQKDRIQNDTLNLIKQKDEFLSLTSHELKTPVTSLKVYTELLLMDGNNIDNDQRRKMLEAMDKQIKKLVALINDLMDSSQLEYGQMSYHKQEIKLNKVTQEIISQVHLSSPNFKIIFQKNINALVNADRDRMGQVLSNLLTNAIKYAPDSKEIIVRLDKTESSVICSIKDFGPGIREDEGEKIFDRFYRVSGENLHTYPGLGLGLYISRQIVEKHNGKLWYESEFGKGSTFYFELPLIKE
ncbi:MAG: HAMP domain-containing sensor histidine kinase [Ginsengibacter sp.]